MDKGENKWIILIEEKEAVVGMLTESGELMVSEEKGWDGEDPNSLVAALDSGIGTCLAKEEGIPRPERTVFILPPFWVSHRSEVLPSRKKILQHVCKQLKINPEGFLVGEEVLANYYDDFVSVYFGSNYLRFSVLKEKSVEVQEELENGDDIDPEDVAVFLRQLNGKAIIPQELVFWGKIKDGNKDRLLSHQWQEEKIFDRVPKIKVFQWPEFLKLAAQVIKGEVKLEVVPQKTVMDKETEEEVVAEVESAPKAKPEPKPEVNSFGFSSQDVGQKEWQAEDQEPEKKAEPSEEARPVVTETEPTSESEPKPKFKPGAGLKKKLSKIKLPRINLAFLGQRWVFIVIGFLIVFGGGLFLSWRFSKATVMIYVTPEELSDEVEVQLDSEAKSIDLEKGIIPADQVSVEKDGEKSRAATGEKLIGEKSTGEVKVFNRTAERAEFSAGTSLSGPGGFEFVFDNDVSVASKTADLNTGVDRWGETTAAVTAGEIGAEYNLAAESTFTIGDSPEDDYLARNESAFSGGTSRKIRAVSEEDLNQLRDSLSEELKSEAEKELKAKLSDSQLISGSLEASIVDEEFTAEVGDEVDNVGLEMTAKVTAAKISQEQLLKIAEQVLSEKIESGYELREGSLKAKLDVNETDQEGISGKLTLKGEAYPRIDKEELSRQVISKQEDKAKELIRQSYPRIYRHEVNYQFPWLKYIGYLPLKPENIIIKIEE